MRRWSRKATAWVTGAIVVLALGMSRRDYQVLAVGMTMTLFVLVAYVRRTPRVLVRRRPSHLRVLEDDVHVMGLNVGSQGAWADVVELHDTVPGYMDLDVASNHQVLPLYKGEMRRPSYSLLCPLRGNYRIGPMELVVSDATGMFEQEELVPGTHELDVVPLYVELRELDLQSRALKYNMGPVTINEMGRSTDFYSIREYIRGDPYKKINWKASAKRRKLMINEDEKETLCDCVIFVDSRGLAATGTPVRNFHETALRCALGMARTLVASKNRVMMVTYNDSVNIVPPGLGTAHNRVVQAMIVETVARGSLTFDWAAGYTRPFIKPRSDVVVFSPLVSDMTFYPAVLRLIRMGHRVVVVTAPLEGYEEMAMDAQGNRALLMGLQRTTNIAELEAAGVQVIEVEPTEPNLSVLVRVGAALGAERLDVSALQEEEIDGAGLPGAGLPGPETGPDVIERRDLPRELQEAVLGVRTGNSWLMGLQALALSALVLVCGLSWELSEGLWEAINANVWGTLMDGPTYMLLVSTGMILGWAIAMLLGYLAYRRRQNPSSNLGYFAYAALLLLVLWFAASSLITVDRGGSPQMLVWDLVLLPPVLGAMAVFRRSVPMAVTAVAILIALGLWEANSLEDAKACLAMGLAVAAFMELVWAVERFDRLYLLGGLDRPADKGRSAMLFDSTIRRYLLVLGVVLLMSAMALLVLTFLPSWYATDPSPGAPSPIDAEAVAAPIYLLVWLTVLAVAGRWAAQAFLDSPGGQRIIGRLREHLVLPGRGFRRTPPEATPPGDATGTGPVVWEEESHPPDLPVPHA